MKGGGREEASRRDNVVISLLLPGGGIPLVKFFCSPFSSPSREPLSLGAERVEGRHGG